MQFDDVFVFQCLQQVNFWLKVHQIFRTLQNISNFHLIPCHFNSIHFIKCPVAAKELRANHNMTKASSQQPKAIQPRFLWCNCGKASLSFQFKTSKNLKTAQIGYVVLKAPLPSTSSYCDATSQTHVRNSKILGKAKEKQKILERKEGESNNKSLTERSWQHWPNHSNLWDQLPQILSYHHHHHHHYQEALEDQLQEKTFVTGLYLNTFEDPVWKWQLHFTEQWLVEVRPPSTWLINIMV